MGQKLIRARTTGPKILAAATFCILMPFKASPSIVASIVRVSLHQLRSLNARCSIPISLLLPLQDFLSTFFKKKKNKSGGFDKE